MDEMERLKIALSPEEKLLKNDDFLDLEIILILFNYGSFNSVKAVFGESIMKDGKYQKWRGEALCEHCASVVFFELSKTDLLNYISIMKARPHPDYTESGFRDRFASKYVLLCCNCKIEKSRIDSEAKELISSEQKNNKIDYIETYLNPSMEWKKELSAWQRFRYVFNLEMICPKSVEHIKAMNYYDFLKTPYWKAVSGEVKRKAKYMCQLCGSPGQLAVHHRSYKNHGREASHIEDLICLCNTCHSKYHNKNEEKAKAL